MSTNFNPFGQPGTDQLAAWLLRVVDNELFQTQLTGDPHLFAVIYAACATAIEPPSSLRGDASRARGGEAPEQMMQALKSLQRQFGEGTSGKYAQYYLQGLDAFHKTADTDFPKWVREWLETADAKSNEALTSLEVNVDRLGKLLGMSDVERDLLVFQLQRNTVGFNYAFDSLLTPQSTPHVLALMFESDLGEINDALSEDGVLVRSGLLRVQQYPLRISSPSSHLRSVISEVAKDDEEFISRFVGELEPKSSTASLARIDERDETILFSLLGMKNPEEPINVLIYGPKSVDSRDLLARMLPERGLTPYIVGSKDVPGSDLPAWTYIAQRYLEQTDERGVLVIERAEQALAMREMPSIGSVFGLADPADEAPAEEERASDEGLTDSGIRCLWLTNRPGVLSESNLGRFIFHCEARPGSRADRRERVKSVVSEFELSPEVEHDLSKYSMLGEQPIRQAAKLANLLSQANSEIAGDQRSREQIILRAVQQSQRILGREETEDLRESVTHYSLENLNLSGKFTPDKIVQSLKKTKRGTLCLYGLPGAGKTQLAEYMAVELDLPLMSKRASDLLSKWVGESEQNIAAMFREAEAEGALLFLDEADSFLRDRSLARAEWSVTQVNEILQHMERFDGVFIAATNLFQDLDAAALRRFTWKLEFKALRPEQAWRMFCVESGFDESKASKSEIKELKEKLEEIRHLTPGDFATVKRQCEMLGEDLEPDEWIEQLRDEAKAKMAGLERHKAGFA